MSTLPNELRAVKQPEPCSESCDFCPDPAQIAFAYQTDQPETLACVPCAVERNAEVGSVYMGRGVNGRDVWESIANIVDELHVATEAANVNAETYKKQREEHSAEVGSLYRQMHDLRSERNALARELEAAKRDQLTPEVLSLLLAWIFENLHDIVVESDGRFFTLGTLHEENEFKRLGYVTQSVMADVLRGRVPRRLCQSCKDEVCGGCGFDANDNGGVFRLPVLLREVLKERRVA